MDLDGMPPRRPCKRQPPSPALASPMFSESKRTDMRPSPAGANFVKAADTNSFAPGTIVGTPAPTQSTHNVKGRCPIEMNLACRGAASTSRTNQRRSLNSFQRSFLSVAARANSGQKPDVSGPTSTNSTSHKNSLQMSPVTMPPMPPSSEVKVADITMQSTSVSPNVTALGEAVTRMATSSPTITETRKAYTNIPISTAPVVSGTYSQQIHTPAVQFDPNFVAQQAPPLQLPNSSGPTPQNAALHTPASNGGLVELQPGKVANQQVHLLQQQIPNLQKKKTRAKNTKNKPKKSKPRKPWSARKAPGKWTKDEDDVLRKAVNMYGAKEWKKIASFLGGKRTSVQCLHRWNKVLKPGLVKGPWTKEEDKVVYDMVMRYGLGNVKWSVIASQLKGRIGKQCRERWFNHLDPSIVKTPWTVEEDRIMFETQQHLGNRWCEIAKLLPGRTENMVKNRWNSSARKRWFAANGLTPGPATSGRSKKRKGTKKKAKKKKNPNRPNITINPSLPVSSPGLASLTHSLAGDSPSVDDISFPLPSPNTTAQILASSDMPSFQFSPAGTPKLGDSSLCWDYVVSAAGNQQDIASTLLPSPSSLLISPTALNRLASLSPSGSGGVLSGDLLNVDVGSFSGFV